MMPLDRKDLRRDSLSGQRMMSSFEVDSRGGMVVGVIEVFGVVEGPMGKVVFLYVAPHGFDVIEFGEYLGSHATTNQ